MMSSPRCYLTFYTPFVWVGEAASPFVAQWHGLASEKYSQKSPIDLIFMFTSCLDFTTAWSKVLLFWRFSIFVGTVPCMMHMRGQRQ